MTEVSILLRRIFVKKYGVALAATPISTSPNVAKAGVGHELIKGLPRPYADFLEYDRHRAETCYRRLQQIRTDKSRKKEPVYTVKLG